MIGNIMVPKFMFGRGIFEKLGSVCGELGTNAGVFVSPSSMKNGLYERAAALLKGAGIGAQAHLVPTGEPTPQVMREGADFLRRTKADLVVAIGGGSVIDTGKLAAALATNEYDVEEYIEGIGDKQFVQNPLPFVAAPTTAGTGSEMTKNSVVIEPGRFKNSVRDDRMLARAALVDPMLTLTVPKSVTVSSGADAVCQLVEAYSTKTPNPYTDAIAIHFIRPMIEALEAAAEDGSNIEARETLSLGAAMSGICLANSGLGMAHGISAALGTVAGVPHGIGCGILMPIVAEINAQKGVERYGDIARRLGYQERDTVTAGKLVAARLKEMNEKIGLPRDLKEFSISPSQAGEIGALAAKSSSGRKNPVAISVEETIQILEGLI